MNSFINNRKNNWQKLENLLEIIETSALGGLSKSEVRELGELYRRTASDLAIAREESRDPKLINYLNSLVIRAHGKLYRTESQGINLVWNFVGREFPQLFRKHFRLIALSFWLFTVFGVAGFMLSYNDLEFANHLGLDSVRSNAEGNNQWWLSLNDANQIGASAILTNNILVSLMAFAYGAIFGLGTLYVLIYNGLVIGSVLGICYRVNPAFGNELTTFMIGHGVIELSCIFIAGGAGLLLGTSLINPKDLSRLDALKKNGVEAVKLVLGCAVLLVVAGIIEGFASPSGLPKYVKFGIGIGSGILLYSYLFLVGHEKKTSQNSV